jgi:hypothetical protein
MVSLVDRNLISSKLMTAGDPEEVRVAMIVVTTMVMTLIRWDRNLISLKLFLRWIDRDSPLEDLLSNSMNLLAHCV